MACQWTPISKQEHHLRGGCLIAVDAPAGRAKATSPEGHEETHGNASSLRNDILQILARHDHSTVVSFVHTRDEGVQVVIEIVLLGLIESCESLEHLAI